MLNLFWVFAVGAVALACGVVLALLFVIDETDPVSEENDAAA